MKGFTKHTAKCLYCRKTFRVRFKTSGKFCSKDCWYKSNHLPQLMDVEWCREQYEKMSYRDIARMLGCGETVVYKLLKRHGIPSKSRSERLSGLPKSKSHRLALSASRMGKFTGELSPVWKGGITSQNRLARGRLKQWRRTVRERDKVCAKCGSDDKLHVHHIKPFAEYPQLREDPENGQLLCAECHRNYHFPTRKQGELLGPPNVKTREISSQAA